MFCTNSNKVSNQENHFDNNSAKNVVFWKCFNKKIIFPIIRPLNFDPRLFTLDFRTSTYDPRPTTLDPRPMTLDLYPNSVTCAKIIQFTDNPVYQAEWITTVTTH
jgi:hypothetical protein